MILYHASDTHSNHFQLNVPPNVDVFIFSGDATNYRDKEYNYNEAKDFFDWFKNLDIRYKIFVGGNHDSAIYHKLITRKEIEDMGIIYLENEEVIIEGLKIWGSPYSPTFGSWYFMKPRNTINRIWQHIPDDTDIVITHSPPIGLLDLTMNYTGYVEQVGCSALRKKIFKVKPMLHCFGHVHSCGNLLNAGTQILAELPETIFSNGSVVTDGKMDRISSHGNLFEYSNGKIRQIWT